MLPTKEDKKEIRQALQEDRQDKRWVIRYLVSIKKEKKPNILLGSLIELLRNESHVLGIGLFCNFMRKIFFYTRKNFVLIEEKRGELSEMKGWLLGTIRPVADFLASRNKKSRDFFWTEEDFLEKFKAGTFTGKTIMCYTEWILRVIPKESELAKKTELIFRVFELYVDHFLKPREHYKGKNGLFFCAIKNLARRVLRAVDAITKGALSKLSAAILDKPKNVNLLKEWKLEKNNNEFDEHDKLCSIMQCIDDIIEEYIEMAKPSSYFLASLSELGKDK